MSKSKVDYAQLQSQITLCVNEVTEQGGISEDAERNALLRLVWKTPEVSPKLRRADEADRPVAPPSAENLLAFLEGLKKEGISLEDAALLKSSAQFRSAPKSLSRKVSHQWMDEPQKAIQEIKLLQANRVEWDKVPMGAGHMVDAPAQGDVLRDRAEMESSFGKAIPVSIINEDVRKGYGDASFKDSYKNPSKWEQTAKPEPQKVRRRAMSPPKPEAPGMDR